MFPVFVLPSRCCTRELVEEGREAAIRINPEKTKRETNKRRHWEKVGEITEKERAKEREGENREKTQNKTISEHKKWGQWDGGLWYLRGLRPHKSDSSGYMDVSGLLPETHFWDLSTSLLAMIEQVDPCVWQYNMALMRSQKQHQATLELVPFTLPPTPISLHPTAP